MHPDQEFRKTLKEFNTKIDFPVNIEIIAPGVHVPIAEYNNRFIKERFQTIYHQVPFIYLSIILIRHIVMKETRKTNFISDKHSVSKYYSPCMIID